MKVDILLRTRDYDRDYRWIFKPEYVDRVTEDKMSFLIQMMQKSELKQYLENESLYNLYYLYDENGRYNGIRMMKLDAKNPYSASISFQYEQKDVVLKKMKVFLWGNLNQQIPLCPAKDIELR